ncbi:hypothetical protein DICPUDRAFT_94082 [Dictyostelium purpureum]|uniref:RGS domain-containing protein n=1 Tax=Dictyostelium purpureum TaxID=5786 RepID=F0ZF54_DICPU|nr:uncharacterized protein DICPUDRAFT_94082 [Dictyostelium purpureum]EGC37415.1 hypothetical protein DICPUDRAFT_94082 [Dictyostelium purpureum]|eukprot:XP_003286068.1 hypothetical protein DICPUDRAFT_94082 [Dictyostelium purpureum]
MSQLEQIIKDRNLALVFRQFLYNRFNNENFSFWLEAENYKYLDKSEMEARSKEIFAKYFLSTSKYELNINHQDRKDLEEKINNNVITNETFARIQQDIKKHMETDAIPLFLKSEDYKKYKDSQTMISIPDRDRSVTVGMIEEFFKNRQLETQ